MKASLFWKEKNKIWNNGKFPFFKFTVFMSFAEIILINLVRIDATKYSLYINDRREIIKQNICI